VVIGPAADDGGPLVSVVVDNYNYGEFVERAVESALAQSYPRVEVIVVDDGSTDDSHCRLRRFADRAVIAAKPNGGQASAFNIGFALARGDIVLFLDADDALYPDAVARVVPAFAPGVAKVHFRLDAVGRDDERLGWCNPPDDWPLPTGDVVPTLLTTGRYVTPPTSGNAFRRSALDTIMPIPEPTFRISADGYLVNAAPFHGDVAAIEAPLGVYRVHGDNHWAPRDIDAAQLRAFLSHDMAKHALVAEMAARHNRTPAPNLAMHDHGHLRARLGSLRLDPDQHPMPNDRAWQLARAGIAATLRAPDVDRRRQLLFTLWFLWLAALPRRSAAAAARWFYVPQQRPPLVRRAIRPMDRQRRRTRQ
jgi:hypothetical protein